MTNPKKNTLYYGDNLPIMETWQEGIFDLIYLDPPFNSKANYNILFSSGSSNDQSSAQAQAFQDTWSWGKQAAYDMDQAFIIGGRLADTIHAFDKLFSGSPMLAYLCHLAPRIWQMHRLLKPGGSLYLHCDDTASSHIKLLLDAVFRPENCRNLLIWRRATAHNDPARFGRIADLIWFYAKGGSSPYWNGDAIATSKTPKELKETYPSRDERGNFRSSDLTGKDPSRGESGKPWQGYDVTSRNRHWSAPLTGEYAKYIEDIYIPGYRQIEGVHARLDALNEAGLIYHPKKEGAWPGLKRYAGADRGKSPQNIILDPIGFTNFNKGKEFLGYPTQKPEALLRKLIEAACPPGGFVLDPYCGCGTALHVAEETKRKWTGIDITHLAIAIIEYRFKEKLGVSPQVIGQPEDLSGAEELHKRDPFQFEAWAVSRIPGMSPNERQQGDRGIDGRGFVKAGEKHHLILAQVKGGKNIGPKDIRDFRGTLDRENALMGVFIVMDRGVLTKGVQGEIASGGFAELTGKKYPCIQAWTIQDFFSTPSVLPNLPTMMESTYRQGQQDLISEIGKIR